MGMTARLIATAMLALLAGTPVGAAPACSADGARYTARTPSGAFSYRLITETLPRADPATAVATSWRFQTFSGGKQVSELRMRFGCPNGGDACSVHPPGTPGGPASEVVRLARDFTPAIGDDAPYALILPGFATASWVWPLERLKSPDLTLALGTDDGPDLSPAISWVLSACGGGGARRSR